MKRCLYILWFLALSGLSGALWAQGLTQTPDSWRFCGKPLTPPPPVEDDGTTRITADSAGGPIGKEINFSGNVRVERGDQHLDALDVVYRADQRHVAAKGSVQYQDRAITVSGSTGEIWLKTGRSRLTDTQFGLYSRNARGSAYVAVREKTELTRFEGIHYTTCDADDEDWRLNAQTLAINHEEGFGTATHVWVEFMGVPIMYSPWASFPVDDRRKTGFLVPSFSQSKSDGLTLSLPWYWNMAPNYDATITPRVITKRGLLLETEYRYLFDRHEGDFNVGYLPHDQLFGDDRERFTLNHSTRFGRQWQLDAAGDRVTDDYYVRDLGTRIAVETTDYLEQRLDLSFRDRNNSGLLRAQTYQPLASDLLATQRPYKRLPQLVWQNAQEGSNGFRYAVNSEFVNFRRDEGAVGLRSDIFPKIGWRLGNQGYYLQPSLGYRFTDYQLEDADSLQRSSSVLEMEAGLHFERRAAWFSNGMTQTLEPKLYYLHVPYRSQDQIPLFDTSEREFNYSQLFRDNRFSSADRFSDANQISLGMASNWYHDASGLQVFSAGFGQIFYIENPRILTQNMGDDDRRYSNWVAQFTVQPSAQFAFFNTWLIEPTTGHTEAVRIQSHYTPAPRRILNMGYTFAEQIHEQAELALSWPVADRWQMLGRVHYAFDEWRTLETLLGLEYQSCCWSVRVLSRNHRDGLDDDLSNNILLQLELKGLTNLGSNIENVLERGILGYE